MPCPNCATAIKPGKSFCANCGNQVSQGRPAQQAQHNPNTYAQPQQQQHQQYQQQPQYQRNDQVDAYIQKSSELSKSALDFIKVFLRQPVTTIQAKSITLPQAILFAALLPVSIFVLIRVVIGRFFSAMGPWVAAPTTSDYLGIFFRVALFSAIAVGAGIVLVIIFSKLLYKASVDVQALFSLTVVVYIPVSLAFLASAIFAFISGHLVIFALILGYTAFVYLYPSAIKTALNTDSDKAVYVATLSSTTAAAISWLYLWNTIERVLEDLASSLMRGFLF